MNKLFDVQQLSQFEFGAIIITVLVAGLIFGCLLAYAILKRKNNPDAEAAVAIKEEFEEYKDKVDDHFNKTSEMFKDVTTQYKKLYDHMAVGAIELSKADTISMPRLEMQDTDEPDSDRDDTVIDETTVEEAAKTHEEIADSKPADQADEDTEITEDETQQKDDENTENTPTRTA